MREITTDRKSNSKREKKQEIHIYKVMVSETEVIRLDQLEPGDQLPWEHSLPPAAALPKHWHFIGPPPQMG